MDRYEHLGAYVTSELFICVFWDLIYLRNIHMPLYTGACAKCIA